MASIATVDNHSGLTVIKFIRQLLGPEKSAPDPTTASESQLSCEGMDQDAWLEFLSSFDTLTGDGLVYFRDHFRRYVHTMDLLTAAKDRPLRILELGASFPFGFTLMLREKFPQAEIVLGQFAGEEQDHLVLHNQSDNQCYEFPIHSFNAECDIWPFADASFDLVLCMEMLEHLVLDPLHMFREASRVLELGGKLIVTTPNIASYESIHKLIQQCSPYSFGVYSKHGVYGRHNREYVPEEVERLTWLASFTTEIMQTHNVNPVLFDTSYLPTMLGETPEQAERRAQNIFYRGVKTGTEFQEYPRDMFDFDPDVHRARIAVVSMADHCTIGDNIHGHVRIENLGTYTWTPSGEGETTLRIMLLSENGDLIARDFRKLILPESVSPGSSLEFSFNVEGQHETGDFILRFDMVHERVCWFSDLKTNYQDVRVTFI